MTLQQLQTGRTAWYDVVIVGGGFSAACLAIHLIRNAQDRLTIAIVNRDSLVGRGVAYSTNCHTHILNVPAAKMSILADEPDHFADWIFKRNGFAPHEYVPRLCYGEYVEEVLQQEVAASRLASVHWVQGNVVSLCPRQDGVSVQLAAGDRLEAGVAVMAVGNAPPEGPAVFRNLRIKHYKANAWAGAASLDIKPEHDVLIVGSGLTAIDQILALTRESRDGTIYVLSRRGKLPATHASSVCWPSEWTVQLPADLRAIVRTVREQVKSAVAAGYDWRSVIDSMRRATPRIWQSLSVEEKKRFLRHVRPYWEIARHRIPTSTHNHLQQLIENRRLVVIAGRLAEAVERADKVEVTYIERDSLSSQTIRLDRIVNCTGPGTVTRVKDALLRSLLADGTARLDPLGVGIETAADGALIDSEGQPSQTIFALGPVRKATLWETTAVGEIREQADQLAALINARVAAPVG